MPEASPEASARRRVFFALWPDAELRARLSDAAARHGRRGRPVPAAQLHLTLAFVGTVPAPVLRGLRRDAAQLAAAPFCLRLDRCGAFAASRVQWLGASKVPDALHGLAAALDALLSAHALAQAAASTFVPHVTIRRQAPALRCVAMPPIDWHARDFALVESGDAGRPGAYRVLDRWPLRED